MFDLLFSYEVLRITWWVLLGVLLIGFAIADGFDMGAAALLPLVTRTDEERRVVINTVGPVWEGNQVWFILGGGAIFAAWPALYAVSFSGFYLAMFLVLFMLILRPVAFKYRSKRESAVWRRNWDIAITVSGLVPPVIFGVAVGNALIGVPFTFDSDLRPGYEGGLLGLLNPPALLCGFVSLTMILAQGASWLQLKADDVIAERARQLGGHIAIGAAILFAVGGVFVAGGLLGGYQLQTVPDYAGASFPLSKLVLPSDTAWLNNYERAPILLLAPILGVVGMLTAAFGFRAKYAVLTFIASSIGILGIIGTVGVSMFPFILPSSLDPNHSLMVFDASSSQATLRNMLVATTIFLPLILLYTAWVYKVLFGRITITDVKNADHAY
ncbi:MAG: cytochrome d ubiquinol oxidase subunit II [Pseudomonadota bacterium]